MMLFAICAIREVSRSRAVYRGEQYDPDLGLYYLRARYYNPLTGRFLSRDPLNGKIADPRTLHKYLYAGGDPVNVLDPTGGGVLDTGFIDIDLVSEVIHPLVKLSCLLETTYAAVAKLTDVILRLGRSA